MYILIKQFEGCKLDAYYCPSGIPTIGWGNTFYKDGSAVKIGDRITQAEADDLLVWYCQNNIKLPKGTFNANQIDALYSLIYNIGQKAFDKSNCKKAIENKDWREAYNQWNWIKSNGVELTGLIKRRNAEKKKFFQDIIF